MLTPEPDREEVSRSLGKISKFPVRRFSQLGPVMASAFILASIMDLTTWLYAWASSWTQVPFISQRVKQGTHVKMEELSPMTALWKCRAPSLAVLVVEITYLLLENMVVLQIVEVYWRVASGALQGQLLASGEGTVRGTTNLNAIFKNREENI